MARRPMPSAAIASLIAVAVGFAVFAAPAGAADDKPLEYKEKMLLKDVVSYNDQVEDMVEPMERESAGWMAGRTDIAAEKVRAVLGTRDKCVQYLKHAKTRLDKLPAKHADVAPEVARYEDLGKRVTAVEKKAEAVSKGLSAVAEQGKSLTYKVDFDRLREINLMLSNPQALRTNPRDAVEVVKLVTPMKAERKRIAERYAELLKQDTPEAEQLRAALKQSEQTFGELEKAVADFVTAAPAEIDQVVDETLKLAQQAVAERKPAVFAEGGGVPQRVASAEERYAILAAIDPDSAVAKAAEIKVRKLKGDVAQMGRALRGEIVAGNSVPAETYAGPDAEVLRQIVKQKWEAEGAGSPVLKIGLNSQAWQRDTRWEWNRVSLAFEKVDRSRAQGFVVVPLDGETGAIHYVDLVKDHLAADAIKAYFPEAPKDEPHAGRLVLLKNVK
jgi:hypothetical protein